MNNAQQRTSQLLDDAAAALTAGELPRAAEHLRVANSIIAPGTSLGANGNASSTAPASSSASSSSSDDVDKDLKTRLDKLWVSVAAQEQQGPLLPLVQRWIRTQKDEDGEAAIRALPGRGRSSSTISRSNSNSHLSDVGISQESVTEAFELLLRMKDVDTSKPANALAVKPADRTATAASIMSAVTDAVDDGSVLDEITGALLMHRAARRILATFLKDQPNAAYEKAFVRGDDTTDGMIATLLDPGCWDSEKDRVAAQRDVYQLALAKLMSYGLEHPERAMKSISRLLAAEASHLKGLTDGDGFEVILASLDFRQPAAFRSHGTLAASKLLEDAPDVAEKLMAKFVRDRVTKGTNHDLVLAFSASATLFPMAQQVASELFLTKGFIENLIPLITASGSRSVALAALELLNAACIDRASRIQQLQSS